MDEPTSGLDSMASLVLVQQLKRMAKLGMTIIMIIHQPWGAQLLIILHSKGSKRLKKAWKRRILRRYKLFTLIDDVCLCHGVI